MKIGITCYPTYGGSGAVATELGIALAQRGHEIHFITYQQPFRLPSFLPRIYFHEVDVGRYPLFEYPPYDLALAVRMHEVVLTHGLDLLHVHYAIPHATSAWIAREMLGPTRPDIKVLTTLHGTDITIVGQDPSFHAITKFSIEKSDGITSIKDANAWHNDHDRKWTEAPPPDNPAFVERWLQLVRITTQGSGHGPRRSRWTCWPRRAPRSCPGFRKSPRTPCPASWRTSSPRR